MYCFEFFRSLLFGCSRINIGDISTGKIKPIIDCLYPIIGGSAGHPEDWRIIMLQVRKGVISLKEDEVHISIELIKGGFSSLNSDK